MMPSHHTRVDRTRFIPSDFASANSNSGFLSSPADKAAEAVLKAAKGTYSNPSFQAVLTKVTSDIYNAGGKVISEVPASSNDVKYKASLALSMLALMTPVNSSYRNSLISAAASYYDSAESFPSYDLDKIQDESKQVANDLKYYVSDAIITSDVKLDEVNKWRKYVNALFGSIFNIEQIERAQKQDLDKVGVPSWAQGAAHSIAGALSQTSDAATDTYEELFGEEPPLIPRDNAFFKFWQSGTLPKAIIVTSALALTVGTAITIRHFVKKQ